MHNAIKALGLTAALLSTASITQAQPPSSSGHVGNPFSLAQLRDYTSGRVSSENRESNADMRSVEPGETLTLAEIEGPGEITHIWTTIATQDKNHLQNIVFRIYWDDNDYPSVESPLGDFFGLGMGKYYEFSNPVQAIGTINGMNCFWPMPFNKKARITATNESDIRIDSYYYYVDYRKYDKLPENSAYFHAQYKQATPTEDGKNYLIAETSGGRGHFAGVSLSIHTQSPAWWGEGDDIFTIDGEERPSLWGTGSEDYFCGAWCYGATFYNDYFGMPLRTRIDQGPDNFWNVYRLHLESPITFKKSIKVEIEHGIDGVSNTRQPRNNNYYSCAYWYVDTPRPLVGKLASAADRLTRFTRPEAPQGMIELQYLDRKEAPGVKYDFQEISRNDEKDGDWINADQLFAYEGKEGDVTVLEFETTETMKGPSAIYSTRAKDYGIVEVKLDDKLLAEFDGYNPTIDRVKVPINDIELPAGKHTITVTIKGKNPKSTKMFWGIDALRIGGPEDRKAVKILEPIKK